MWFRFFLLILISPLFSFGHISDWNEEKLKFVIMDACEKIDPEVIAKSKRELDNYRAGIYPSVPFNQLLNELSRTTFYQSIESTFMESDNWVDYIRQNPGYRDAIFKCNKKSKIVAGHIDQAIISTKIKGQVLAAVVVFGVARGGLFIWKRLGIIGKRAFGALSTISISAWAYSLFGEYNKSHQISIQLEKSCGPKTHPEFSKCVGQDLVARVGQLEKNLAQTDQYADAAKAQVKGMVERQIRALSQRLQEEKSPTVRRELEAQLKDRKELFAELN